MELLDDPEHIKTIDKSGMMPLTENLPFMAEDSIKRCLTSDFKAPQNNFSNILVAGMGGSAMSGDIFKNVLLEKAKVPVSVVRDYEIPFYASPDTLVFVLSYSGNTEETLSAYKKAKAKKAKTIVVASGGKIKDMAIKAKDMIFSVPGGLPPRASLPYMLVPLIYAGDKLGLAKGLMEDLEESVKILYKINSSCAAKVPYKNNPAKKLSVKLRNKVPFILGSAGSSDAASYRWKCQISENSKATSIANIFPELDHNELVNLARLKSGKHGFAAVFLRDRIESASMKKRIDITKKIISKTIPVIEEIRGEGNSLLSRILSLCYLGDFVSVYLAVLNGVDPTPVDAIEKLKKELAKK